eukprot:3645789-Pleurochrysis_carterae.AAC.1
MTAFGLSFALSSLCSHSNASSTFTRRAQRWIMIENVRSDGWKPAAARRRSVACASVWLRACAHASSS